ncbi:NAD(P)H-binding protein [Streptomyces sp. NPDC020983]|uniref:NAD(P)H-binding protein n=1 Tax=Streptomyces sp. NPDC020983 TaxID=3365106 RepID=UPI0037B67036
MSIVVTGATGQLGRLVMSALLRRVPAGQVVAAVRDPGKASGLAEQGVEVRPADYDRPGTLAGAFREGDTVLLISADQVGRRLPQHTAVVEAAAAAGVARLVYTGILGGPAADFALADEHKATERLIVDSGLVHTFLRNGWYTENYTAQIPVQLAHGVAGATGEGRIGAAPRADYAEAAAVVLTTDGHDNTAYELSGDDPFTLAEYAAEVARLSGRRVDHHELEPARLREVLVGAGVPAQLAGILVDVDVNAIRAGLLEGGSGELARLVGRPTGTLADAVAAALKN